MPRVNRFASVPSVLPSSLPPSSSDQKPKKRRKQSILDLLAFPDAADHNDSREQRGESFRDTEYKNLSSSEDRVSKAMWAFKRDVLTPYEDDPEASNLKEEVKKFMEEQTKKGLSDEEINELKIEAIVKVVEEKKEIDTFKVLRVFGKTVISYADIATDVLVLFEFMSKNKAMAIIQGTSLGFSMLMQCFISLVMGQPIWVGLLGLVGMKPILEAWRDAIDAKPFPSQKTGNDSMLMFSRMTEVVFESIPQSLVQTTALLVYPDQRSYLQFISLFASFLTTGFMVVTADREQDTDSKSRRNESALVGYALINSTTQIVSSIVCFTCYKTAKMFSLALLIASSLSAKYCVGLLLIEHCALSLVRLGLKNLRIWVRDADGLLFTNLVNFGWYICLLAAPFPTCRWPHFLTPRIYSAGMLYMCTINFALVYVSYRAFDARNVLPESQAWVGLSAVTFLCVIFGVIAFNLIPQSHRHTFYKHLTLRDHINLINWHEKAQEFDHKMREVTDQDGIRALMPLWISLYYLPTEKLIELYRDNWKKWSADPPYWFDDEFKSLLPRELLVEVDQKLWGEEIK